MTRGPRIHVVALATLALFLTVLALLVFQLRTGRDPALGATVAPTSAPAPKKKRILIRKVIITRRVVHLPAETSAPAPATRVSAPASAPAASAPAPAPAAPAPAPAPAPLTTQSS